MVGSRFGFLNALMLMRVWCAFPGMRFKKDTGGITRPYSK